jgi:L-proline 3-hydroxylase, C-terminal/Aspartyl/Asparaginyl beta-hydroxylase
VRRYASIDASASDAPGIKPALNARPLGVLPSDVVGAAASDALRIALGAYVSTYDEYSVGPWSLAPLWSDSTGDSSGASREHDEPARPIAAAASLEGINRLINTYFSTRLLRTVRLVRASHGALIIPHVDYLEHDFGFTRIHVPLVTDPAQARSVENDTCFHMRRGEVWFLDARVVHSGGVIGPSPRLHLVLDFDHNTDPTETVTIPLAPPPNPCLVDRPPLPSGLLRSYMTSAPFVGATEWRHIVRQLAHVHLRYDASAAALYDWLEEIARASTGHEREFLIADAQRMRCYFLIDGPNRTMTFEALWDAMLGQPRCGGASVT